MKRFRTVVLQAVLLVVCAGLLGVAVNHQLLFNAFAGRVTPAAKDSLQVYDMTTFPVPVLLDEVKALRERGATVVDARPRDIYLLGHIAGAASIPMLDPDEGLVDFRQRIPHDRILIIYCSGYGCQDSFDLAMLLISEGYRDVRIYEGGFPEWQAAGLAVTKGVR